MRFDMIWPLDVGSSFLQLSVHSYSYRRLHTGRLCWRDIGETIHRYGTVPTDLLMALVLQSMCLSERRLKGSSEQREKRVKEIASEVVVGRQVLARKREVNVWNKLQLVLLVFERQ